jgi:hypothetical protein
MRLIFAGKRGKPAAPGRNSLFRSAFPGQKIASILGLAKLVADVGPEFFGDIAQRI